jgi:hypothetical protein
MKDASYIKEHVKGMVMMKSVMISNKRQGATSEVELTM